MKIEQGLALTVLLATLSACTSLRVGSEVQSGRQALLAGNNEAALAYFQSAAQKDPNYRYGTALQHSLLSYIGRMEYATGQYKLAQQTLERALAANGQEAISRLYLGLVLARSGERQRALKEIDGGMRGIHDWIEYITQAQRNSFGQYWDPARAIRSGIQADLARISKSEFDWQRLIAEGEWVGKQLEEEIDNARRDESRDRLRDGEGRDSPNH